MTAVTTTQDMPHRRYASGRWQGIKRHLQASATPARWAVLLALPAFGGALTLNLDLPNANMAWSAVQGFVLAITLFAIAARLVRTRKEAVVALAAWYAGSTFALVFVWHAFFNDWWGWALWLVLSAILALPAFLAPRRRPALGVAVAVLITAVPPLGFIGLGSPLLAAGALFPGAGWFGLVGILIFLGLSAFHGRWPILAQILILAWAMAHVTAPPPAPSADAWGVTTYISGHPAKNLTEAYDRQDYAKKLTRKALEQGAKVVILPEGTDRMWDVGQVFYWKDIAALARRKHAQVLLGAYTSRWSANRINGIVDLTTGVMYPAFMSAPASMWRPWLKQGNFPLQWGAHAAIPTRNGPAAYLVCYEELLTWPLAVQEAAGDPKWLVSVADQWFDNGWMTRPQRRAVRMQARLWGLPLVRSVNHAPGF